MGLTNHTRFREFADDAVDFRTVTEIRTKVTEQSKRNVVSRLLHAKNDKEKIVAWKLDLNRILHVFNVRSVTFTWLPLIISSRPSYP